ncbi:hypothetical protein [Glycomyces buryatensis]|uniref:Heparinase n=1 Tax=Glycomyces buryatensis TaxID=2570927 RepID=A0A4S8QG07_9ACTN|nr:hypothetical protein [Glycomyces buryatensis]THV42082.1 hypothetical protein FAB82_08285 [Glycomyces buryatensis]
MRDSRTETDSRFVALVTEAADAHAKQVLDGAASVTAGPVHHRKVMWDVGALVACCVNPGSALHGSERAAAAALGLAEYLESMQGPEGLFDGENLASPPDTAFTINDLCDAYALLNGTADPLLGKVAAALERIAVAAAQPLLHGGVHTPNHRWELCAALARLHRHWPDERLVARVDQWLAEGVDIAADGMYSERSAIYALYVSNPSLTAIGLELDRPKLLDAVCRNLEAIMGTTLPDGTVETVHSRRQDQRGTIDLTGFLMQFRRFAIARDRGDFAGAVAEILESPLADPARALTEILLDPALAGPVPQSVPSGPIRALFPSSSLAVVRDGVFYASVYGGSDYAEQGRIRSGLASNPTFLRMAGGAAVLDAVRLSRDFFGLGPFRSDGLRADDDGTLLLRETVSASYYGPLPDSSLRSDGDYELADEGRFSAAMDFARRPSTEVEMTTRLRVRIADGAVELTCEADPARVRQTLELTFKAGGDLTGVREASVTGCQEPEGNAFAYRCGEDIIEATVNGAAPGPAGTPAYHPGEDYTHLSGTDAIDGAKVHIPLGSHGPTTVLLKHRTASRTADSEE